jgi:GTPase
MQKKASKLELETHLGPENDNGNIEYKIHIIDLDPKRFHRLATQMKWRMSEGKGNCVYFIGISDSGSPRGISHDCMEKSLKNIINISKYLGYTSEINYFKKGISGGFCAKVCIFDNNSSTSY